MTPRPRVGHKELAKRVSEISGMPYWESKVALYSVIRAMHGCLLDGDTIVLQNFGTFHFVARKPRTIPARTFTNRLGKTVRVEATKTSENGLRLKFTPAPQLLKKMKERKTPCPQQHP